VRAATKNAPQLCTLPDKLSTIHPPRHAKNTLFSAEKFTFPDSVNLTKKSLKENCVCADLCLALSERRGKNWVEVEGRG